MKKFVSAFFIIFAAMIFSSSLCGKVKAASLPVTPNVTGKSAILMDYNTRTVITEKDSGKQLPIASMTKIMTLLICFEEVDKGNLSLEEDISVSKTASGMGGSQAFLEAGATYKAKELLKSIAVASANDACVALAERLSGSESAFVAKMNERASELGLSKTNFVNCTGLPAPMHHSTASDVAVMLCNLISHPTYFEFSQVWLDEIEHPKGRKTTLTNTNKLVKFYEGCDGGKTGYTTEAGHCLAATAMRGGMRLIAVVIAEPDSKTRFKDASDLLNFGFANYTNKMIVDKDKPFEVTAKVVGGKSKSVPISAKENYYTFASRNEKLQIQVDFVPFEKIKAPIEKGDICGKLQIFKDGNLLAEIDAVALQSVEKQTYLDNVKDVLQNWNI